MFAQTPEPPYYAVIFTNQRTAGDNDYGDTSERMMALAKSQPGYLGVESVRVAKVERAYAMAPREISDESNRSERP